MVKKTAMCLKCGSVTNPLNPTKCCNQVRWLVTEEEAINKNNELMGDGDTFIDEEVLNGLFKEMNVSEVSIRYKHTDGNVYAQRVELDLSYFDISVTEYKYREAFEELLKRLVLRLQELDEEQNNKTDNSTLIG